MTTKAEIKMAAKAIFDNDEDAPDCMEFDRCAPLVKGRYEYLAKAALKAAEVVRKSR
jgi:DNA-binding transcriptional regulator of glucitol operon